MDLLGASLRPLEGGYSGETFLAEAAGEQCVVRIYGERSASRGPRAVEVDASVLRLVRGLLPVADVLEVRRPDEAAGTPALLVTSRLPGERLDLVLPTLDELGARRVAENLAVILARLSQMPFLQTGLFVDGGLTVDPMSTPGDLADWVSTYTRDGVLAMWSPEDLAGLGAVAETAQDLLDTVGRYSLVHSDFNTKNLLVDPGTGEVTGLLDWEFAHAGSPYADLGNLLRFERHEPFAGAVLAAYLDLVPGSDRVDPRAVLDLARAADLVALVDLAGKRDLHDVGRRAHDLLRSIAVNRDLHAWPSEIGPEACGR